MILTTTGLLKGIKMKNIIKPQIKSMENVLLKESDPQTVSVDTHPTHSNILLEAINPPVNALRKLHDALLPFSTPQGILSNRNKTNSCHLKNSLWLISNGSVSLYRGYDDLKISGTTGPMVIGLGELFEPIGRYYFRASRGSKVSSISINQAKAIFTEQQLWQDVADVLSYAIHIMIYRDEHLVSKSSYSIIRAKLLEYMQKKESIDLSRTGIVAYIQETTHLSRSLIYNIISQLTEGGYIKTSNGKLVEIIKPLPKNY